MPENLLQQCNAVGRFRANQQGALRWFGGVTLV